MKLKAAGIGVQQTRQRRVVKIAAGLRVVPDFGEAQSDNDDPAIDRLTHEVDEGFAAVKNDIPRRRPELRSEVNVDKLSRPEFKKMVFCNVLLVRTQRPGQFVED